MKCITGKIEKFTSPRCKNCNSIIIGFSQMCLKEDGEGLPDFYWTTEKGKVNRKKIKIQKGPTKKQAQSEAIYQMEQKYKLK